MISNRIFRIDSRETTLINPHGQLSAKNQGIIVFYANNISNIFVCRALEYAVEYFLKNVHVLEDLLLGHVIYFFLISDTVYPLCISNSEIDLHSGT